MNDREFLGFFQILCERIGQRDEAGVDFLLLMVSQDMDL